MINITSESLKKCHEIISRLNEQELWIPRSPRFNELSFLSEIYDSRSWKKENNRLEAIYNNVKTYIDFDELVSYINKKNDNIASNDDILYCNEVFFNIFGDKSILKSFNDGGVVIVHKIYPQRYVRCIVLRRILARVTSLEDFAYWKKLDDFSDVEHQLFNGRPYKFHKRLVNIMYGYASGDIREAYSGGIDVLEKYEKLLTEMHHLGKSSLFKYLTDWRGNFFYGDDSFSYAINKINEIKASIITTRNDDALNERALVVELLKLFSEYGNGNPVSSVYRFTRSRFIINNIERKTIQRCWDALAATQVKKRKC